jgi:hypothetical protein
MIDLAEVSSRRGVCRRLAEVVEPQTIRLAAAGAPHAQRRAR